MRLQPYQTFLIGFSLFIGGLLLAMLFAHGHAQAPSGTPFETPF